MSIPRWADCMRARETDPNGEWVLYKNHIEAMDERYVDGRLDGMREGFDMVMFIPANPVHKAIRNQALQEAIESMEAARDENRQGTDPEWGVLNQAVLTLQRLKGDSE